ncbi:MAG: putative CRISPR-associated protein [Armatimonadetes bacterium]|nr:putative CRISPR-associated protein [Armatimonadota bacterium]
MPVSMPRAIVSTVGTSMLTNGAPQELRGLLIRTANTVESRLAPEDRAAIVARADEVRTLMAGASHERAQKQSAEINGVVRLGLCGADVHYLIATDTLQGRLCSEIAASWIRATGSDASAMPVSGLTTADTESFGAGINNLLQWCDMTLPACRRQQRLVAFNLVGGFKAMQAYMQALGMFYADEIVYIFESGNDLIRIPRLPVTWDHESLREHASVIARLAHGAEDVTPDMVAGVPEAYLEIVSIDGRQMVALSTWGRVAWLQNKQAILGGDLIEMPHLSYEARFERDYRSLHDPVVRMSVQDAIARVSALLGNGGIDPVRRDGSLQYTPLKGSPGIDHFRVTQGLRVSCAYRATGLVLRRCGAHDDVLGNP